MTEEPWPLRELISSHVPEGAELATISRAKPNWVVRISDEGVYVETEASRAKGLGAQLVPAWMFDVAWQHLRRDGSLTHRQLLNELNVKRSAAVLTVLSRLPGVIAESRPEARLRLT